MGQYNGDHGKIRNNESSAPDKKKHNPLEYFFELAFECCLLKHSILLTKRGVVILKQMKVNF